MPRIPQILAAGDRDAPAGSPRLDAGGVGALAVTGLTGLARSLTSAGDEVTQVVEQISRLEARKQAIAASTEAAGLTTQYALQLEDLASELERTPDPLRHAATFEVGATRLRAQIASGIKDVNVRAFFQNKTEPLYRARVLEAKRQGDALFVSHQDARGQEIVQDNVRLMALTDDPALQREYADTIAQTITGQVQGGIWKEPKALEVRNKAREEFAQATAIRHMRSQPLATAEALEQGAGPFKFLDPTQRLKMADQARARWEQNEKDAQAARDKQEKDAEKIWKRESEAVQTDLFLQIADPNNPTPPSLDAIRLEAEKWGWTREQTAALVHEREKDRTAKEASSTQEVYNRLAAGVLSIRPSVTERELDAARASFVATGRGLNTKDWVELKRALASGQRAEREHGESTAMRHHAQAEQEIHTALNVIPGKLDAVDNNRARLLNEALVTLRARSNAYGGKENPLAVKDDMLPGLYKAVGEDGKLQAEQIRPQLLFNGDARQLKANKDRLPPEIFRQQERFQSRLAEIEAEAKKNEAASANKEKPSGYLDWLFGRSKFQAKPPGAK